MILVPSRRLAWIVALSSPLWVVSSRAAAALLGASIILTAIDALIAALTPLRAQRSAPERLGQGDSALVTYDVRLRVLGQPRVLLTDERPAQIAIGAGDGALRGRIRRGKLQISAEIKAIGRGTGAWGKIRVRWTGPLGLAVIQRAIAAPQSLMVHPGLRELRSLELSSARARAIAQGNRRVMERGGDTRFESLRDYIPGDDPRRIDWKATARRRTLISREYGPERSRTLFVAVDAGRTMLERIGERNRMDEAMAALTVLAGIAGREGDRVGACAYHARSAGWVNPLTGRAALPAIATLARDATACAIEPDYPALERALNLTLLRRSLVVVIGDLVDPEVSGSLVEVMTRLSARHVTLFVALGNRDLRNLADSPVIDHAGAYRQGAAELLLSQREREIGRLRHSGVHVVDALPGRVAPAVIDRYLQLRSLL